MKYIDVINATKALNKLRDKELPGKIAVTIARNLNKFEPIMRVIGDKEMELANKYGTKDENGNAVDQNGKINFIDAEAMKKFTDERTAIYEIEEDINVIKLNYSDIENVNLTVDEVLGITFMLDE